MFRITLYLPFILLEGECYGCSSYTMHVQTSTPNLSVNSITYKCHAYNPLVCTTYVYISMHTYCNTDSDTCSAVHIHISMIQFYVY